MSPKTAIAFYLTFLAITLTLSSAHARFPAYLIPTILQQYELPSSIIPSSVVQRFGYNYQLTDAKVSGDDNGGFKPISSFISDKGVYYPQKMNSVQEYAAVRVGLDKASTATFSIQLMNANANPAGIYGQINCTVTSTTNYVLFNKKRSERINVMKGSIIPLDQYVVDVTGASQMKITTELMENDGDPNTDYTIANGLAVFNVKESGVTERGNTIPGSYGSIQVFVTWN